MEAKYLQLFPHLFFIFFISPHSPAKVFLASLSALCELFSQRADGGGVRLLFRNKRLIEPTADTKK